MVYYNTIYKEVKSMEEKKLRSNAQKKADKKYSEKTMNYAIKYTPTDINDGLRLKQYLLDNGLSANSYIKQLIKNDLNSKGVKYTQE